MTPLQGFALGAEILVGSMAILAVYIQLRGIHSALARIADAIDQKKD